jgi:hypothetical protein
MRFMRCLAFALLASVALGGGPAFAKVCQTANLACASTMPMGGFCQCAAHGTTENGTVMSAPKQHMNATAGGCGTHPNAPGCGKAPQGQGAGY